MKEGVSMGDGSVWMEREVYGWKTEDFGEGRWRLAR